MFLHCNSRNAYGLKESLFPDFKMTSGFLQQQRRRACTVRSPKALVSPYIDYELPKVVMGA